MKQIKPTKKELEQEKIDIEKRAKVMWNDMSSADYDACIQQMIEELRLNMAENEDLAEEIKKYCERKPKQKEPNVLNTSIPVILTALAGSIAANALISAGVFEPNLLSTDLNDLAGGTLAGLATGGITGLVNAGFNCTKPITRAIFDRQIAKRQRQLDKNHRRNNAITYLEECLEKEEAISDAEFSTEEVDGQLSIDDMYIGHA